MSEQKDAPKAEQKGEDIDQCCGGDAMVEVSESHAKIIMYLNLLGGTYGTMLSSCLDRKGCNWHAFVLAYWHSALSICCCLGWYKGWVHGKRVYEMNKGNK